MDEPKHRIPLPGLSPDAFVSPADRAALRNLQRLPLLPILLKRFNEYAVDRFWYLQNTADSIRCSPGQYSTIYQLMKEACEILDVPEPELYIRYGASHQAMTAGVQRPFIVLNSALIKDFTDEELTYIIGHELGHVKCGHVLYQMVGQFLMVLLHAVGQATLGLGQLAGMGLVSGFYEWLRQSEFTCDRAGLLACQDIDVALSAIMKIGGGSSRFDSERSIEAFLVQARGHSERTGLEGAAKALLFFFYNWQLDHPQVVFRARGLDDWVSSGAYHRILSGEYPRSDGNLRDAGAAPTGAAAVGVPMIRKVHCKRCRKWVPSGETCTECGSPLPIGARVASKTRTTSA